MWNGRVQRGQARARSAAGRHPVTWGKLALAVSCCLFTASCYNYVSPETHQRNRAKTLMPAKIAAPEVTLGSSRLARVLKVRAYATPNHASQVLNWQRRFRERINEVNKVLHAGFGYRLELEQASAWRPSGSEENLTQLLEALEAHDSGDGATWVVGLLGQVSRYELDFRRLGLARDGGKHLLLRTANDAEEFNAVAESLDLLSEAERQKFYRERKQHKATVIFLHELGHTLGCQHLERPGAFMASTYSTEAKAFAQPSAAQFSHGLAIRAEQARPHQNAQRTAEAYSGSGAQQATTTPGYGAQHGVPVRTEAPRAGTASERAAGGSQPHPTPGPANPGLQQLTSQEHTTLETVNQLYMGGKQDAAWSALQPLVAKYPTSLTIQELRCKIAMAAGWHYERISEECKQMMDLTLQ